MARTSCSAAAQQTAFAFASAAEAGNDALRDQIRDFEDGSDLIDLSGFGGTFEFIGSAGFSGSAGELRAFNAGAHTYVAGDLNGDLAADFEIFVLGHHTLSETDFVL